jgi:hypothetical protein
MNPRVPLRVATVGAMLLLTGVALANNYFVDALKGNDLLGNGSATAPWRTITRAHQAVLVPGDRVLVAPGVYDAALGEVFPITLKSQVPVIGAGAERTFVRGTPSSILFQPGLGQTWYRLMDMTLADASVAVSHVPSTGSDTFLLLERLVLEDNATAVRVSDFTGIYSQCALFNCQLRGNDVGLRVEEAWLGFGGVFAWAYGCTLVDNGIAIRCTTAFGNPPKLLVQHSIVKDNGDDLFVGDFFPMAPVIGCVTSEPTLIGVDGNVDVPPGFVNPAGGGVDPHLRNDSGARDLLPAESTYWPPAPAPGVPGPEWWGLSFAESFDAMPDLDGRTRADGLLDAGCDENEVPFVYVNGQPSIGGPVQLVILNASSAPMALYLSAGASQSITTPYGTWKLDAPFYFLGVFPVDAQGHLVAPAVLPAVAAYIGIDLYLQGHPTAPPIAITPVAWLRILP